MGTNTISLPVRFSRYDLSRLVNEALGLEKPVPFDFIVDGKLLRVSLSEYMSTHGLSSESTLSLEYVPIISTPEEKSSTDLPDWVSGIACTDNKYVAGCYDGTIHIYNMDDTLLAESSIHKRPIKAVDCTSFNNSFLVATASLDNTVHISSLESTKIVPICALTGHDSHVLGCRFSPAGNLLASCAWNGSLLIWDTTTFQKSAEIEPKQQLGESLEGVSSVSWWETRVVSGGWDHHIRVWDLESEGMLADMVEMGGISDVEREQGGEFGGGVRAQQFGGDGSPGRCSSVGLASWVKMGDVRGRGEGEYPDVFRHEALGERGVVARGGWECGGGDGL